MDKTDPADADIAPNGETAASAEEAEPKPKHIYKLKYRFLNNGNVLEDGQAKSQIDDDRLVLLPLNGMRVDLLFRDVRAAKTENYALELSLKGGETAVIYFLGTDFDSYIGNFFKGYNKTARKDSFMAEKAEVVRKGAKFRHVKEDAIEEGGCDLAFGKTAIILQRSQAEPARIPYALISDSKTTAYSMQFFMGGRESWEVYMLADRFDKCQSVFAGCVAELAKTTSEAIKEAKKDITPLALRKAAMLFLDGRAISKPEADAVCMGLWEAVFAKSKTYGAGEYFDYLKSQAREMRIGFKKALLAGEEDYLWLLAGIRDSIILEAASPSQTGRATYVFSSGGNFGKSMDLINYCLHMIEFRREPVYMSEQELHKEENARYLEALRRVPELNVLRGLFVKRVMHPSFEKWQENLEI